MLGTDGKVWQSLAKSVVSPSFEKKMDVSKS